MELSLAPIQGMTNAFQRNIYHRIFPGMDTYYAPFIAPSHMRRSRSNLFNDVLPENNSVPSLIPQLLGNQSEDFLHFSKILESLGYKEVNWNIGCPFPQLTKKRKGSGILPYPDMIRQFLEELCLDLSIDLTVKMRLGLETISEGSKVIEVLNDFPIKSIIIHGRTGIQRYEGEANIQAFDQLYRLSQHPVHYNGDIFSVADYTALIKRFPKIQGVMMGRGALRNPFLSGEIKGHYFTKKEKLSMLTEYHNQIYAYYQREIKNPRLLFGKMKEFWTYAAYQIDSRDFLSHIQRSSTKESYESLCAAVLVR